MATMVPPSQQVMTPVIVLPGMPNADEDDAGAGSPAAEGPTEPVELSGRGGYPKDDFTGTVDDSLLCTICLDVAAGAVSCNHGHTYCFECIMKWLENNQTCPVDRAKLTVRRIIPSLALRNIIGQMEIKCDAEACEWKGPANDIESHEEQTHHIRRRCKPEIPRAAKPAQGRTPGQGRPASVAAVPSGGGGLRRQLQAAMMVRSNWAQQVAFEDEDLFTNPTLFHVFEYLKVALQNDEYGPVPPSWAAMMSANHFYSMIEQIREDLDYPLKVLHSKVPVICLGACMLTCCAMCPCYFVHAMLWRKKVEDAFSQSFEAIVRTAERYSNLPVVREKGLFIGVHVLQGRFEFAMGSTSRVLFLALHQIQPQGGRGTQQHGH